MAVYICLPVSNRIESIWIFTIIIIPCSFFYPSPPPPPHHHHLSSLFFSHLFFFHHCCSLTHPLFRTDVRTRNCDGSTDTDTDTVAQQSLSLSLSPRVFPFVIPNKYATQPAPSLFLLCRLLTFVCDEWMKHEEWMIHLEVVTSHPQNDKEKVNPRKGKSSFLWMLFFSWVSCSLSFGDDVANSSQVLSRFTYIARKKRSPVFLFCHPCYLFVSSPNHTETKQKTPKKRR